MIDYRKTPGYDESQYHTFYVQCPHCERVLQERTINDPLFVTIICRHCKTRFPAYGHIQEEEQ